MKNTLKRLSLILLVVIAAYFVNDAYQLSRSSSSSYGLGFAVGQALTDTLFSPLVWVLAVGALVCFLVARRSS